VFPITAGLDSEKRWKAFLGGQALFQLASSLGGWKDQDMFFGSSLPRIRFGGGMKVKSHGGRLRSRVFIVGGGEIHQLHLRYVSPFIRRFGLKSNDVSIPPFLLYGLVLFSARFCRSRHFEQNFLIAGGLSSQVSSQS
jgi:hypothetical protein